MEDRVVKFRIGVIVLGALMLLAAMVVMFSDGSSFWVRKYVVFVHFPEAPGVANDTPVRKDGILIGKVVRVRFADDDPRFETEGGVIVTVSINADRRIRLNERCRISSTLLGDAVLQFVPGGTHPSPDFIEHGDYLEGTVAPNPLQLLTNLEGNMGQAISSVAAAGNDMGNLARRLDGFLDNNGDQLQRIVSKTENSLDSFQRAVDSINVLMGGVDAAGQMRSEDGLAGPLAQIEQNADPATAAAAGDLRRNLTTVPQLMNDIRDAVTDLRKAVDQANKNLGNLERFTQPLGDNGDVLIGKVNSAVGQLNDLLKQIVLFSQALNRNEGTVGKLVHDPELYNRINAIACTVQQILTRAKVIVEDVRVFTDKIARHPGIILREAVRQDSGVK